MTPYPWTAERVLCYQAWKWHESCCTFLSELIVNKQNILKEVFYFWAVGVNNGLKILSKPRCKQMRCHPGFVVPCVEHQFSSVAQSCPTLCNAMDCSTPGLPVHHQLPEFTQTHIHWVGDAIQPLHPLSSPSAPDFNLSQHQRLFKWVSSLHQVAKVLEFQLHHQSFQWIFRTHFL